MMGLGMLLFWIVPIGVIVAVILYLSDRNKPPQRPEQAIDILEKAYARGEIGREEFLRKREDLLGRNASPHE